MCFKLFILLLFFLFSAIFGTQILCGHRGPENIDRRGIMETHISLHDNGTMTGTTSLKSKKRNGFTGGVGIAFFDEDQVRLWHGEIHEYNVKIRQPKSKEWIEQVPLKILPKIKNIAIVQRQTTPSSSSTSFWDDELKVIQLVWNGLSNVKKPK